MKTGYIKTIVLLVLLSIYNLCFWQQNLGINLLVFTLFTLVGIFVLNPFALLQRTVQVAAAGCVFMSVTATVFNSNASVVGAIVSFLVLVGFSMFGGSRFVPVAFWAGVANLTVAPWLQMRSITFAKLSPASKQKLGRWWRLVIFPILVVLVFYGIFYAANPQFAQLNDRFWNTFFDTLWRLIANFSWGHFFFLLLGLFILSGTLFHWPFGRLYDWEAQQAETTTYQPNEKNLLRLMGLNEYSDEAKAGLMMLVLVNLLLLVVNSIDIKTQWLEFEFREGMNLSQMVHEGTGLLIFSILLSIGILLYLFRGNINYLPQGRHLRTLAYLWIVQNGILCLSVGVRNYHYIQNFGLAYKRIGVVFFLALTLFGLVSLTFKIAQKRSAFYLIRLNAWAVYFTMLSIACCNWDLLIARHNLNFLETHGEAPVIPSGRAADDIYDHIDYTFLMRLSDKSLQAFLEHPSFFKVADSTSVRMLYKAQFDWRVRQFLERKQQEGTLSWNYAEQLTQQALQKGYTLSAPPNSDNPFTLHYDE